MIIWFRRFLFPRSQKKDQLPKTASHFGRQCPYRHEILELGLFFWGLAWANTVVGQEKPCRPGRMNTSHEQETTVIYFTYICTYTHWMADGLRHTKLLLVPHQRHGPCGEAMPTRGRRRPAKSCGGVLAACRCNIDDTAVWLWTTAACERGCSECCFVFAADASGQRKKWSCSELWGVRPRHTHTSQHAPRTWRRLKVFARLPFITEHTQQQHSQPEHSLLFFSTYISHRSRLFARIFFIFQIPRIWFPLPNQPLWLRFSHAVWNPFLFLKSA